MSPRTIPGERYCEVCGSRLKPYQARFCCVAHQRRWLDHYEPAQRKKSATLRAMMARREIPKPPRATGPFKFAPSIREAIHLVKTGARIDDLTPEQQALYRDYNREHQRERRARAKGETIQEQMEEMN